MATDKTPSSKHGRLHEEEAARDKSVFGTPDPAKAEQERQKNLAMRNAMDRVAAQKPVEKLDPFPEPHAAITLDDIAAEFGPEATIRGNTNLGLYEVVTPKGFYAIDRDKVAKLKSKAELRAYVEELKAK